MFVIACIIFDDDVDAEFAGANIKMLKKKLGWKQEREFKFHRATEEQKEAFFRTLKDCNFNIRAVVVDKTKVTEPKLKKSDSFYSHIIMSLLDRFDNMDAAKVWLDGSGSKDFRRRSTSSLRKSLNRSNKRKISSFSLEDSRNSSLIQLADMVAGSIRVKYNPDKKIKRDYLHIVAHKISDIWEYDG